MFECVFDPDLRIGSVVQVIFANINYQIATIRRKWTLENASFHLRLSLPRPSRASHHVLRLIFGNPVRHSCLRGARLEESLSLRPRAEVAALAVLVHAEPRFGSSGTLGRIEYDPESAGDFSSAKPIPQAPVPHPLGDGYARAALAAAQTLLLGQSVSELTALERAAFWLGVKDAAAGQGTSQESSGWRERLFAAMRRMAAPSMNLSLANPDLEALRLVGVYSARPILRVSGGPRLREPSGAAQVRSQPNPLVRHLCRDRSAQH